MASIRLGSIAAMIDRSSPSGVCGLLRVPMPGVGGQEAAGQAKICDAGSGT